MFKLIRITKNLADVFYGVEGWEPWSRVEKRHGKYAVIGGNPHLPAAIWQKVKENM